ncbi:substrate-binding domain-containing protein [bacterium]|nr:substrate-binding domain-containing protein [bacterium]
MQKCIGVVVPELKHAFFAAVLDGIQNAASEAGYFVCVSQSREDVLREKQEIASLLSFGVSGLLVSIAQNTKDPDHFQQVLDKSVPLVFFDRVFHDLNASRVVVDDHDGAYKATEHLILSGYKKIAHIAGPQYNINMKRRFEGYKAALAAYDMPFRQDLIVFGALDEVSGTTGMQTLLGRPDRPDAVFAVNDPVAIGALFQIRKAGLHIHDDVALVGFSDNPVAALIDPPLTTVAQPRYEIGKTAAELLISQIGQGQGTFTPVEKVLKTRLIIRQSS